MARNSDIALGSAIAAKIACCGSLALAASGMLSGVGAWLTGSGYLLVGGAAGVLLVGGVLLYHRRGGNDARNGADAVARQCARLAP